MPGDVVGRARADCIMPPSALSFGLSFLSGDTDGIAPHRVTPPVKCKCRSLSVCHMPSSPNEIANRCWARDECGLPLLFFVCLPLPPCMCGMWGDVALWS